MRNRAPRKILFLADRDNLKTSRSLLRKLMDSLQGAGIDLVLEDPGEDWIERLNRWSRGYRWFPDLLRSRTRIALKLVYGLFHWRYLILHARERRVLAMRCRKMRRKIELLGKGGQVFALGFSSGARAASLIADGLPVRHLICIGYPFQNPERGVEPDRFLHLGRLETPALIVQGTRDAYGGTDVAGKYPLSPGIEFLFIEADHRYDLDERNWEKVLAKIKEILA